MTEIELLEFKEALNDFNSGTLYSSVKNFDEALSHPDEKDFADARQWAQAMVDAV